MKIYLLVGFLVFVNLTLSAQCSDYQSELQNVESNISIVIKNLKKTDKATKLEEAQQLLDKTTYLAEISLKLIELAKEYATACGCVKGIQSATIIYDATFDCYSEAHAAAGCSSMEEIPKLSKKILTIAESIRNEISDGISYCIENTEEDEIENE
jgi:hypothetical protein